MKQRILNLLIALDQFIFCVITLGKAMPDETMSAAAWRGEQLRKQNGKGHILPTFFRPIIDALFWFDKDHCFKAYRAEVMRSQYP